jgi:hypothetical protein
MDQRRRLTIGELANWPPAQGPVRGAENAIDPSAFLRGMAEMTPVLGDAMSGGMALEDLVGGNYGNAALNAVGLLPFVPGMTKLVPKTGRAMDIDVLHGSPRPGLKKLITNAPPAASKGVGDEGAGVVWGTTRKDDALNYSGGSSINNQAPVTQMGGKPGSIYKVKARVNNPYVMNDLGDTSPHGRAQVIKWARENGHDSVIFRTKGQKDYEVALFNDVAAIE